MGIDSLEVINITNNIITVLLIFPGFLNLKYYLQTKIKDYLYVSLFFTFVMAAYWSYPVEIYDNHLTNQISMSLFYLAAYFGIRVAIRTKWENPPNWANNVANSYVLISFLNLLIPNSILVGETDTWIGQYFYNPLNMFSAWFIVYCFLTTQVAVSSNSKAVTARRFWISFYVLFGFQDFLFYFLVVIRDIPIDDVPLWIITVLQVNYLVGNLIIFSLHLFFPEAVLYSHEQIIRAQKMYKMTKPADNFISKLGIDTINKYIEAALEMLVIEHSGTSAE